MKLAYLLPALFVSHSNLIHASQNITTTPPGCRKLNTDADWPSPDVWKSELPGVLPSVNTSDKWGPLPDYRLQARSIEDVQRAVRFVRKHNIRLAVLTTGHDQQARNDAGSGLIIDLSLFQGVRVMQSYTPSKEGQSFGAQAAVTYGPAVAGLPLNYALSKSKLFTVSGGAGTVAVGGGWGQNGGYGPLTKQYGLGVDQWLEALIVTPDGELRVANCETNTDLFWAIRGGGGGTFGIVVQATWKAYPTIPVTGFNWYINSTRDVSEFEEGIRPTSQALEYLLGQLPALHDQGISAVFYVRPTTIHGFAIHPGPQAGIAKANAIWGPILEHIQTLTGITPYQTRPFSFTTYREFFDGTYGPLVPQPTTPQDRRGRGVIPYDSRLLGAEHLTSPNLTDALRQTGGNLGVMLQAPGMRLGDGKNTAVNPGWRRAVALVIANKSNTTNADGLRRLAPDMGTYINEASVTEPNFSSSFWGTNYPRLSKIKYKLDPNMTFWVSPGINADHMHVVEGRACLRIPAPSRPTEYAPATERWHPVDMAVDGHFIFGDQEITGSRFPEPGAELGLQPT
ncbi:hypothetical protein BKA63DRAFT_477810 [Paraphoma chrysanthemicola]|nr:hypothetical protein BKA63DRAFT_477810 [Paraphoma chrysanthemicola]